MATHPNRADPAKQRSQNDIFLYGIYWAPTIHPAWREMQMVQRGGRWVKSDGTWAGISLFHHFREAMKLIWPEIVWHKWNNLIVEKYLENRTITILGPASSGKTHTAAACLLADYYCFSKITTGIVCSTTRERLEDRVWGEIKRLHKVGSRALSWLPGNLIEGKQRLVTDDRTDVDEGRDFRNGIVGVPCKQGGSWVGLGDFAGIKNKRVRLLGDELHLLPRIFVDAISNLDKNPDFKAMGLGNPKETTDALGILGEPAPELGGWEGGIDQTPVTKSWKTKRTQGVCIQLVGSDSPNLDGKLGIPIISQVEIDRDVSFYGKESLWFTMMDQGMMPRGQGARRVLTRQLCLKSQAMEEPIWLNANRTKIGFLDAAYRAVGGDRCVFGQLEFGPEGSFIDAPGNDLVQAIIDQRSDGPRRRQIMALVDLIVVPIKGAIDEDPETQIVDFVRRECGIRDIPPQNFFYDSGMRTSLVSAFCRLWSTRTNPIDCGGTPSARKVSGNIDVLCKDYYSKFITELWFSVRLVVEAKQFRGMTEEVMLEGCSREWKMVGANKIEVETKEEMKMKHGRSPDLFDALAMGVEGARRLGFDIIRLANEKEVVTDSRWKSDLMRKAMETRSRHQLNHRA